MPDQTSLFTDPSDARIAAQAAALMALLPTSAKDNFEQLLRLHLRMAYLDGRLDGMKVTEESTMRIFGKAATEATP